MRRLPKERGGEAARRRAAVIAVSLGLDEQAEEEEVEDMMVVSRLEAETPANVARRRSVAAAGVGRVPVATKCVVLTVVTLADADRAVAELKSDISGVERCAACCDASHTQCVCSSPSHGNPREI